MSEPVSEDRSGFDWEARFQDNATPWEREAVHPALAHWRELGVLVADASVYVPGCGRGLEPSALAQQGLIVTASDRAPSAAQFQRKILAETSSATVIEGDSLAWRPDTSFDLLHEQTFLCAIHPHRRKAYEAMAYEVLKPGGRLLALFMQKDERGGPPYGCSLPAMRKLFTDDRWQWPQSDGFVPFPHPNLNGKPELAGILIRR